MNRRGFLAALAGAVLDPERLLWRPGKLISIPAEPKRWVMSSPGFDEWTIMVERWKRDHNGVIYRTLTAEGESSPFSVERWPGKEMPILPVQLVPDPLPWIPDSISLTQTITMEEFRRRYPR